MCLSSPDVTDVFYGIPPVAGQIGGKTKGDVQADAGTAAVGGTGTQTGTVQAGGWEEEPRGVHEDERWIHQPAGTGAREVSAKNEMPCWQPSNLDTTLRHLKAFMVGTFCRDLIWNQLQKMWLFFQGTVSVPQARSDFNVNFRYTNVTLNVTSSQWRLHLNSRFLRVLSVCLLKLTFWI